MALLRSVSTIGGFTMLSRIFGFVRDMLVARFLGAGMAADAFFVAFKIPNFLRRLFAEGAFNAAFVPLFAGTLEAEGEEAARRFAEEIAAALATILLLVVACAEIFMPWILLLFAPGFVDEPEKYALTVLLTRLTFPYIFFISLVTLFGGILNSLERFAAVAATPVLLNLCLIGCMVFLIPHLPGGGELSASYALAVGVALAGLVQWLWLAWVCHRHGWLPKLRWPRLTPRVKRLLVLAAPAAFGAGVAQVNLLIDVVLASLFPGAVSWLYYADRLVELPIGVVGVAVGTALLPLLTKRIRSGQEGEAITALNHAIMLAFALCLPATLALITIPAPLVQTIFEHGAFAMEDRLAVVPAMIAYAAGLPAFILIKLFSPGFFAREDTKTPVKIATLCVLINLVGNLILMQHFGHVGLAMATSLSAWVNASLMGLILFRRGHFQPDGTLAVMLTKMALATAAMTALLLWLPGHLPFDSLPERVLSLALLVAGGLVSYAALLFASGAGRQLLRGGRG